jgi:hypothetical protein
MALVVALPAAHSRCSHMAAVAAPYRCTVLFVGVTVRKIYLFQNHSAQRQMVTIGAPVIFCYQKKRFRQPNPDPRRALPYV